MSVAIAAPRSLRELVATHGGVLDSALDPTLLVRTVGASDWPDDVDLAPLFQARLIVRIVARAKVLIVSSELASRIDAGNRWVHSKPESVIARLLAAAEPAPFSEEHSVHPSAQVDRTAIIDPGARIARDVVIYPLARIESGAIVYPGVHVGRAAIVGAGSIIGHVGFGFDNPIDPREASDRIPHRAGVFIDQRVEIGPLCTIDAGVLSPTKLGSETKIDAHVHVGHGVRIGARCRIAAQVGFAGSVVIEDDVHIGGQAGIADHVVIGKGARIAAKSGVIGDVPANGVYAGYPAVSRPLWLRGHAMMYGPLRRKR